MPFRVSSGPSVGRTIVIAHSAAEAVKLYDELWEHGAENLEIRHLELGEMTMEEVREMAAQQKPSPEQTV